VDQPPIKNKITGPNECFSVIWSLWFINLWSSLPVVGTGNPNANVTGSPPQLYLNKSGGANTTLWVKESGINTNTGWTAK
jgi:hypothetical protein